MNAEAPAASTAPSDRIQTVTRDQLPLSCPPAGEAVWNLHPRVYLPIAATGEAVCPYCSTRYRLAD